MAILRPNNCRQLDKLVGRDFENVTGLVTVIMHNRFVSLQNK